MRISDWSSDVCSSDLEEAAGGVDARQRGAEGSAGKKLRRPAARREAALRLVAEHGFSQRRACRLIEVDPKTVRREATADAQAVRPRLCELAGERRRFGYRRLGIRLAREGHNMKPKKIPPPPPPPPTPPRAPHPTP